MTNIAVDLKKSIQEYAAALEKKLREMADDAARHLKTFVEGTTVNFEHVAELGKVAAAEFAWAMSMQVHDSGPLWFRDLRVIGSCYTLASADLPEEVALDPGNYVVTVVVRKLPGSQP